MSSPYWQRDRNVQYYVGKVELTWQDDHRNEEKVPVLEIESRIAVTLGWQERGMGNQGLIGAEFQDRMMKKLWRWMVVMQSEFI